MQENYRYCVLTEVQAEAKEAGDLLNINIGDTRPVTDF
jgi:hypothetical protein